MPDRTAIQLIIAFLVGGMIGAAIWLIASNAEPILDFIAPDRHTTLEEGIARIEARYGPY